MSKPKGQRGKRKLTSLTIPLTGGGVGWETQPGEYDVAKDLFSDVGVLRVLSFPLELEGEKYTNESILNIRKELSEALKRLPRGSAFEANMRSMRDACNAYLQAAPDPQGYQGLRPHFEQALRRWRETVYEDVKAIAHGLDLEEAHRLLKDMRRAMDRDP